MICSWIIRNSFPTRSLISYASSTCLVCCPRCVQRHIGQLGKKQPLPNRPLFRLHRLMLRFESTSRFGTLWDLNMPPLLVHFGTLIELLTGTFGVATLSIFQKVPNIEKLHRLTFGSSDHIRFPSTLSTTLDSPAYSAHVCNFKPLLKGLAHASLGRISSVHPANLSVFPFIRYFTFAATMVITSTKSSPSTTVRTQ